MTRNGVTTAAVEKERGRVARIVLLHDKRFRIVATRSLLSPSLSLRRIVEGKREGEREREKKRDAYREERKKGEKRGRDRAQEIKEVDDNGAAVRQGAHYIVLLSVHTTLVSRPEIEIALRVYTSRNPPRNEEEKSQGIRGCEQ